MNKEYQFCADGIAQNPDCLLVDTPQYAKARIFVAEHSTGWYFGYILTLSDWGKKIEKDVICRYTPTRSSRASKLREGAVIKALAAVQTRLNYFEHRRDFPTTRLTLTPAPVKPQPAFIV